LSLINGKIKLTCFRAIFCAMELRLVPRPGGYCYRYHGN